MLEIQRISLTEMFEHDPYKRTAIWTQYARCYVVTEYGSGSYDYLPNSFIAARDIKGNNLPPIIVLFQNENHYVGVFTYSESQSHSMGVSVWCNLNIPEADIQPLLDKLNELTKHS